MINFDKLPTSLENSPSLIPEGTYKGTIEKAEMKMPKDESKAPYLSLTWNLVDKAGKNLGKLFDILSDSEKPAVQHKLYQFVTALEINLGSTFELRDLAKVAIGKTALVKVIIDKKSEPNRNQVNLFDNNCYMPDPDKAVKDEDIPFNKESASDSNSAESY